MIAPTNNWKLGLFVVLSFLLGLATVVYFGARSLGGKEVVIYTSYFDESVGGLDVGSPVNFRGVTIGNVSSIKVAPDRRHVKVDYKLNVAVLQRLGLVSKDGREEVRIPHDVRAQITTTGITGGKFLQIDFFPGSQAPMLPFEHGENTIPSTTSTLKNLQDAVVTGADQFPHLMADMSLAVAQLNALLRDTREKELPEKASALLTHGNQVVTSLQRKVDQLEIRELSREARGTVASMNGTVEKLRAVIDRVDGDRGLMQSLQRASDSVGDVAVGARGVGPKLDDTLGDLRDAAEAVRRLASAIERQPDMLVKGRAKGSKSAP